MSSFFCTFSPDQDEWSENDIISLFTHLVKNVIPYQSKHYCATLSYGEHHDHLHFHIHLVNTDKQGRNIRRTFIDTHLKRLFPNKERYQFRVERQKGTNYDVHQYVLNNNKQTQSEDTMNLPVSYSKHYLQYVKNTEQYDLTLSEHQLFSKIEKEFENICYTTKRKEKQFISTAFFNISKKYNLYRISDFVIQRMLDDLERRHFGTSYTFGQNRK